MVLLQTIAIRKKSISGGGRKDGRFLDLLRKWSVRLARSGVYMWAWNVTHLYNLMKHMDCKEWATHWLLGRSARFDECPSANLNVLF